MTTWVLLRGLAREAGHWGRFPDLLRSALPSGEAVVALDLPGNGRRSGERSPARIAGMVTAVRAELAAGGHAPPYVLVAVSLGGMAALHWAHAAPGEVRACALVNASLARFSWPWQRLRAGSWPVLAGILAPRRPALARETAILRLTSNLPLSQRVVDEWADIARVRPVTRGNALRQLIAAARFRAPARPAVPLLLLASSRDRLVAPACSRAMAAAWDAPLHEHPWAGHDLPLDDPEWLAERIGAWARERGV